MRGGTPPVRSGPGLDLTTFVISGGRLDVYIGEAISFAAPGAPCNQCGAFGVNGRKTRNNAAQ